MTRRADAPHSRGQPLDEYGFFTRDWFLFLTDDRMVESSELTITNATSTTFAHGQKAAPRDVYPVLRCLTAELGYAVDDEVRLVGFEDANDYGVMVVADATNVYAIVGANGIRIMSRTSIGAFATITNGNWRIVVRAWI